MGDAAGVGPELCLSLLARHTSRRNNLSCPLIIGDGEVLARVAKAVRVRLKAPRLDKIPAQLDQPAVFEPPGGHVGAIEPGSNQLNGGRAAARYIEEATKACLSGHVAAMVTAPISKKALNMAGIDFPGHTEMLAHLTGSHNYAMLLYSKKIACAFVTCHQALRTVPDALSVKRIIEVTELAISNVEILKGIRPRLCLLGLNPHAGEEGLFGDEEQRVLIPAKKKLAARGIEIDGPLPPDTAFTPSALHRFDCHIAMYHDQGSIPFKMLAFDSGVNITMGLSIIRTSPDHGTAFDIAWKGKVNPDSFFSAYDLAVRLAKKDGPTPIAQSSHG